MAKVRIPTPLQKLAENQAELEVSGTSVKEVLANLEAKYPGFQERLYDDKGQLRRFINFYVNEEDIRFADGEATILKEDDELSIVPAIAGG
ncbi:MAG: MoaD/ThiS family protein [Deltaproteobacteria bacterium]|nr:MoaD/ThiS family protein [Deltaproteobacteria bacterium]